MTSPDIDIKENSCLKSKSSGIKKERRLLEKNVLKTKRMPDKKELLSQVINISHDTTIESSKSISPPSRSHSLTSSGDSSGPFANFEPSPFPAELTLYCFQMQQQLATYAMMQGMVHPFSNLNTNSGMIPFSSDSQFMPSTSCASNTSNEKAFLTDRLTNQTTPPISLSGMKRSSSDNSRINASNVSRDVNCNTSSGSENGNGNGNGNNRKNYKSLTRERRVEANARERSRVHTISAAFESLRQTIPSYSSNQKLSKLAILRIACRYIESLACLLDLDYSGEQAQSSFNLCVQRLCDTLNCESRAKRTT